MFNWKVFEKQKIAVSIFILFLLALNYLIFKPSDKYSKKELLIDINQADLKQLIAVPYIGKKTAKKILNLRKEKGEFKSVNELKSFRNFNKFKKYIKVEKNAS